MKQDGPDKLRVTRDVGKGSVPELQTGAAKIIVTASRKVLRGMRTLTSTASKDVQVRLERPRVAVLSTLPLRQPRRLGDDRLHGDAARRRSPA